MEEQENFLLDSEDVRERIEQQRVLAAQLQEKFELDEQQLASKQQQNELLKSKLSLLKSRTKAKRNVSANDSDDRKVKSTKDPSSTSPKQLESKYALRKQQSNSTNKGKINILREQLEQNRLRCERHGMELSEDTRSMEAMVEQLRNELEERDVTIQQLQAGQPPSAVSNTEEQIVEPMDVGAQLLRKEQELRNLTNHVSDLQNTILELQENLKEKDCVIEARTQAISLLSEDMSKKWRANVDMLEETRQQMQIMQENFVRIEAGLNSEIEQLNLQLQNNVKRLSQAELNVKAVETVRNDLASQNAKLLAELSDLKEAPKERPGLEDAKLKIEELTQALSEANKLTVKLKTEHKTKVKTLNKQIDSLRKESDLSGELVQLQNHIAELEEEKGNLQLHLIEIEESTASQKQKIIQLQETVSELQNQKIVAEMKLVELEEQQSGSGAMQEDLTVLKLKLEDRDNEILLLKEKLSSVESSPSSDLLSDLRKELNDTKSSLKEWQRRYEDLEMQCAEKLKSKTVSFVLDQISGHEFSSEDVMQPDELHYHQENLVEKVRFLEESMHQKQVHVQELQSLVQNNLVKIDSIQDQEAQIAALQTLVNTLKKENENLTLQLHNIVKEVSSSENPTPVEIPEAASNLQKRLIEASGELELKREECARLDSKLKAQLEKVKKIAVNLKVKTIAHKELEEKVNRYEALIQNSKAEIDQLVKEKQNFNEKWQMEISEKDAAISEAAEMLALREMDVQNLNQQLEYKSSVTAELETKLTAMQAHVNELQLILEEKSAAIEKLTLANAEHFQQVESGKLAELQAAIISVQSQLASESEEKQAAISKLENFTKQAKLKLAKEKKVRTELLEKQSELEALLVEKNNALIIIQEQHRIEMENARQEQERFVLLLREKEDQVALLRQEIEEEKSKLQLNSEGLNAEVTLTFGQEPQVLPTVESFQNEVEDLCSSFDNSSPHDVLLVLEEEKTKTLSELSSSFEALHSKIVSRLQNRPDFHGDRKLFAELQNLITRVINRTAALENKIKKIVVESDMVLHSKLQEAEKNIQTLENSLEESRNILDVKEEEKIKLTDIVNNLNEERWNYCLKIQDERQKLDSLEMELKEAHDNIDSLVQIKSSLQNQVNEKEHVAEDLQCKLQSAVSHSDQIQQQLFTVQQQNDELKSSFEQLHEECEAFKSRCQVAEVDIKKSYADMSELKASNDAVVRQCEAMQQQVNDSMQYRNEIQSELQRSAQEVCDLQQQLANAMHSATKLQEELSERSDTFSQQSSAWAHEKSQFEDRIHDLTVQLQAALEKSMEQCTQSSLQPLKSEDNESLQKQLAEKTAELENYQRRLIQLQMSTSESTTHQFNFPPNMAPVSQASQEFGTVAYQQAVNPAVTGVSSSLLDAFKPAASLFETPTETKELQDKIQNMSEQLNLLLLEKKLLEDERTHLQESLECFKAELDSAKSDVKTTHSTLNDLQIKVSELTGALVASEAQVEQEKSVSAKLQEHMRELQWKLENEKYDKEKAESELKVQAQEQADQRPDIPQTLDTHVSSLQDSGSDFNSAEKDGFETERTDESLMESNMTQLECELRGMVMSQRERALKQKTEGNMKENTDALMCEVDKLRKRLTQLETEKKTALGEIDALQSELKVLSQPVTDTTSATSQTMFSVGDSVMNEDDGWGWGSESAHLEIQHQLQKNQNQVHSEDIGKELQEQIDVLKGVNETLEMEKLQLTEDLKASQLRAAKLARKLRDLKAKYDEVVGKSRSTDSPLDSLDQAIEEERMKQVQGLEKELKDIQAELCTVRADRDRLQKQVDVFISANERMVEAKERQDIEVEMWQKSSKDLTSQVQALQWRLQELEDGREEKSLETSGVPKPTQTPETLSAVETEQLLKENHTWNTNYENLMQEYQKLRAQCLAEGEQRTQIDSLVTQQKGMIERLEHEKTYFQDVYDSLKMDYESACAQLAAKQAALIADTELVHKVEELQINLTAANSQLQEAASQLDEISSKNASLQDHYNHLNNERENLLQQLEQGQRELEASAVEIKQLQDNVHALEVKLSASNLSIMSSSQVTPVNEIVVAQETFPQSSSSNASSTILNWGNIVSGGDQQTGDIFDSIASSTTQNLEEQLQSKENELQKDKRMIETLKRNMEKSEQEWSQIIEYHKSQLQLANNTIGDLRFEIESLKQSASNITELVGREQYENDQQEKQQELQNLVFMKEKEIESLQINLALSEETKKKLVEELNKTIDKGDKTPSEVPQNPVEILPLPETIPGSASNPLPLSAMSIPVINASHKNLSNDLDLALYMLHERDVRCEELTLELTQLLEERDGLQLRLSNAIRTNEELRERLKQLLANQTIDMHATCAGEGPGQSGHSAPVESSQDVGTEESTVDLQNKLTELRKMGYNHDKRLKEDSEYRHQQQMRLLSPSPPTIVPGNVGDPAIISETVSESASVTPTGSDTNTNNIDQSTSNESQGSLLGWFWGRN